MSPYLRKIILWINCYNSSYQIVSDCRTCRINTDGCYYWRVPKVLILRHGKSCWYLLTCIQIDVCWLSHGRRRRVKPSDNDFKCIARCQRRSSHITYNNLNIMSPYLRKIILWINCYNSRKQIESDCRTCCINTDGCYYWRVSKVLILRHGKSCWYLLTCV